MDKERTILIVDDMEVNRFILRTIFQDEYNIVEAENGSKALEILNSGEEISAILLDIMMPVMNGIEFLKKMKEEPKFSKIPVLVNTQLGEEKNEIIVLELGADDFIIKPYNANIVKRRVHNIISKYVLEREKLEAKLRDTKQHLDSVINTIPGGIVTFEISKDQIHVVYLNDGMKRMLGYKNGESKNEMLVTSDLDFVIKEDRKNLIKLVFAKAEKGEPIHTMFRVLTKNKNCIWLDMDAVKFKEEENKKIYHAIFTDMTVEKEMSEELEYRALHDLLTGLYNQETFYEKTAELLKLSQPKDYEIIYWNIERFKGINDLFGKEVGDKVIVIMAEYLEKKFGKIGLCGRLSADHFVSCVKAGQFDYEVVLEELHTEFKKINIYYSVSVLCGIYEVSDLSLDVALMCDRAKLAAERIKNNFLHPIGIFHEQFRDSYIVEQELIGEMERALKNGDFYIVLQPIYNTTTGRPVSAEALVRWSHPEKGTIFPGVFIPLFEQNGFITELDEYVWEQVCKSLADMKKNGEHILPISINLSRLDLFEENVCEKIEKLIKKYELDPWMLKLEITESAYTDNSQQLAETLLKLKNMGFEILMDDFGSGYSSLNMLKNIPVDILKIDMKFIDNLELSERGASILVSVNRMAKLLNMIVVAEGVETKYQYEFMRDIGCDRIQGYYFSKPVEIDAFREIVKDDANNRMIPMTTDYRRTILIVDDVELTRVSLMSGLEDDYRMIEAENGQEAMEILQGNQFRVDLIITDIIMPVMDGIQMLKEIKENVVLSAIPILVVSGLDDMESERQALEAGAMDFIRKPFDAEAMLHKVQNLLKLSDIERLNKELNVMKEMAERDGFTSLMNRITFQRKVDELILNSENPQRVSAFIMMDIDAFKRINDKYGHLVGDKVLIAVAEYLKKMFRKEDLIARLGGDEFAVFLKNGITEDIMEERITALCGGLSLEIGDQKEINISSSIGLAFFPQDGSNFTELYRNADTALYESKRKGKGQYTIFENI